MQRIASTTIAFSALAIILLTGLLYLLWQRPTSPQPSAVTSFDTCIAAGHPIMESMPRRCRDPKAGITYTEQVVEPTPTTEQALKTRTYTSEKGIAVELNEWSDSQLITSPLTLTGRVPGNWSFEASFPVELTTSDGAVLHATAATLTEDWMTTALVPFTATLPFEIPTTGDTGFVVLKKDNPSGLPENDDVLRLPIQFR